MYLTFDLQDTEIHIKLYKDVLRIPVLLKLLLKSGKHYDFCIEICIYIVGSFSS